ncbi:MAG: hypothetical protein ACO1O6_00910 [Bacteroidota bacterium]
MDTIHKILISGLAAAGLFSCQRTPTACIEQVSGTYKVGDTIKIQSCSTDADTYIWKVDDKSPNTFDDPFFGNHQLTGGGDGCEPWMELYFFEAGTHTIELTNPVLKTGECNSAYKEWSRKDITSITVTITN